jgi:hypothetical protein
VNALVFVVGVIIFSLIRFLPIKTTKPNFYNSNKFKPKPVRIDWFWFGSVQFFNVNIRKNLYYFLGALRMI